MFFTVEHAFRFFPASPLSFHVPSVELEKAAFDDAERERETVRVRSSEQMGLTTWIDYRSRRSRPLSLSMALKHIKSRMPSLACSIFVIMTHKCRLLYTKLKGVFKNWSYFTQCFPKPIWCCTVSNSPHILCFVLRCIPILQRIGIRPFKGESRCSCAHSICA